MRALARVCGLLVLLQLSAACFLNSCPYRRYGRTLRCASCGLQQEGICVAEGQCCWADGCAASSECTFTSVCPEKFCRMSSLGFTPGFCITKGFCCTNDLCQKSMMCL